MKKSARLRAPFRVFQWARRGSLTKIWSFASWRLDGWSVDFDVLAWPGSGILSLPMDRVALSSPRYTRYACQKGYKRDIVHAEDDINGPSLFVKRAPWRRSW